MRYEIIKEIKNDCANNQMRDVFFTEEEIPDVDAWIRQKEPFAQEYIREEIPGGIRYTVIAGEIPTVYTLSEV